MSRRLSFVQLLRAVVAALRRVRHLQPLTVYIYDGQMRQIEAVEQR